MNFEIFHCFLFLTLLEVDLYSKGVYFFNESAFASLILGFIVSVLGFQLLWEKKNVPSVVLLVSFALGAYLGMDVNPLSASDLVIAGSLIVSGLFVALNIEMTLVGFAVMSIVAGFFHGHAYGVQIPDSDSAMIYILTMFFLIGVVSLLGFLVQRSLPKTSYLQMIGVIVSLLGVLLLLI